MLDKRDDSLPHHPSSLSSSNHSLSLQIHHCAHCYNNILKSYFCIVCLECLGPQPRIHSVILLPVRGRLPQRVVVPIWGSDEGVVVGEARGFSAYFSVLVMPVPHPRLVSSDPGPILLVCRGLDLVQTLRRFELACFLGQCKGTHMAF